MKVLKTFAMLIACMFLSWTAFAQTPGVGTPDRFVQFDTDPFAGGGVGPLGHLQAGDFGVINSDEAIWGSIGQSPFVAPGNPYGLRIQKGRSFGLFNLVGNNLIIGFGTENRENIRFRSISNQFTNTFEDIMVAGRAGIRFETTAQPGVSGLTTLEAVRNASTSSLILNKAFEGRLERTVPVTNNIITSIGVDGRVRNQTGTGTDYGGFFSLFSNAPTKAAAFFSGDIVVTGMVNSSSDRRLKRNIKEEQGALERIKLLGTYTYEYRTDEYDYMNLPTQLQHGLIAQEVEKVFPELVSTFNHPVEMRDSENNLLEESSVVPFKSVNYVSLIPILTAAIQELEAKVAKLEKEKAASANSAPTFGTEFEEATLYQNQPNPFSEVTTIRYQLPRSFS
ncbi:MAG: tail fiber domain-containing protein, partial [Bacteroidota bacterium]